jgi:CheY-like chemotaxis protein
MDLYMPEMDGLEVTREIIKERKSTKEEIALLNSSDVYIIALTASASREDRQICIDAGMNDFISKPFTMTEMRSALKTCATCRKKRRKLQQQEDPIISEDDPMVDIEMPLSHV